MEYQTTKIADLKVTFLGTGTSQGVPVIACSCQVCTSNNPRDKRLRSSILIEHEGRNILIDTGPDFRYQMLRENVLTLDAIIYTHSHKDHIAGLDDVRAFNRVQNGKAIDIYADNNVQEALRRDFFYAFDPKGYIGLPKLALNTITADEAFEINGLKIAPILVHHYKMPVLGFRIGDFAYITDAKTIDEFELKKLEGVKTLVLNALQKEPHVSHLTLSEAIDLAQKTNPKQTYFTHISHNLGKHEEILKELPEGISLAYDGLKIQV